MALPKKGSRPIEVDGRHFRWMVGTTSPHGLANLVIEDSSGEMVYCEPTRVVGHDGTRHPVTPAEVTDIIRGLRL
jgi:hypothetical protein